MKNICSPCQSCLQAQQGSATICSPTKPYAWQNNTFSRVPQLVRPASILLMKQMSDKEWKATTLEATTATTKPHNTYLGIHVYRYVVYAKLNISCPFVFTRLFSSSLSWRHKRYCTGLVTQFWPCGASLRGRSWRHRRKVRHGTCNQRYSMNPVLFELYPPLHYIILWYFVHWAEERSLFICFCLFVCTFDLFWSLLSSVRSSQTWSLHTFRA